VEDMLEAEEALVIKIMEGQQMLVEVQDLMQILAQVDLLELPILAEAEAEEQMAVKLMVAQE
jgi:hypothetical protein